jgi:hypothetical protein
MVSATQQSGSMGRVLDTDGDDAADDAVDDGVAAGSDSSTGTSRRTIRAFSIHLLDTSVGIRTHMHARP